MERTGPAGPARTGRPPTLGCGSAALCLEVVFYMLRPTYQGVNYRILYFFSGKNIVVISHGISKEADVPAAEINRAIERKKRYEANPTAHGWKG